ncbi:MAG: hypothetical protein VYA67_22115 [Actinomycetota bacterium]|nr:hypothetical protein [Actinomycetota bacterium]
MSASPEWNPAWPLAKPARTSTTPTYYAARPLPGLPWWYQLIVRQYVDLINEANDLRWNWFGLPPCFLIDPAVAELHPLAITTGEPR